MAGGEATGAGPDGTASERAETGAEADLPSVCVVTHPLGSAGENATRTLLEILGALTAVSLVTAELDDDSPLRDRYPVVELTEKGAGTSVAVAAGRFLLNQARMCRTVAGRDEDVVLFFGATSYLLPVVFARLLDRTVVVEPRGDVPLTLRLHWERRLPDPLARLLAGLVRALERAGFAAAHGVVTYTPSMARQLGVDPEAPDVYPEGARYVDTDRFRPETPYEEREEVVGFVGRLDEEKGIRTLTAVAERLPPDVTFRFVGDGDLRPWLERELADEIEAGEAELTGWVDHDEVPDRLDDLRLLVMPSDATEGLPTTILEALACGTPVYATPVAGVPDVVRDGETGFLMRETDADAIAGGIEEILEREDLPTVGRNGRELVEATYSFDAAVDRYEAILSGVTE
ncbi:glycosyl transferase family 1 [Halobacteriales archaeon QS_4_69_225]|nr:MAG: glycosyl transferase family 1 [Halobacteriales archaeon QS_4_69_225]